MKNKHHIYADYRDLWSSPQSAFEGLIAHSPYHRRHKNKTHVGDAPQQPKKPEQVLGANTDTDVAVSGAVSGIAAGDNPGGFSWHYEPRGQTPIVKGDHLPFVIPTEGGIF